MARPSTGTDRFDFDALHDAVARVRSKQVFFIGGAPKSGTTWLQLLLNAHAGISCHGEGHFANRLLPTLTKAMKVYNTTINLKNQSIFEGLEGQPLFTNRHVFYLVTVAISLMLCRPEKANAAQIVGDKTPDNVQFFPLLATLFPQARFIHIIRDGRDCAVSAWFHNLRLNSTQLASKFPSFDKFAEHIAQIWVANVGGGARFAAENPARCLSIRYEDLSADPLNVLDQVCTFLGASRDAATLRACLAAADFDRLSGGRPRGEEDRRSFFRRGLPGDWRNHFDARTERAFRMRAEPWLSNFRYTSTEGETSGGAHRGTGRAAAAASADAAGSHGRMAE